jgi:hypothetical protein
MIVGKQGLGMALLVGLLGTTGCSAALHEGLDAVPGRASMQAEPVVVSAPRTGCLPEGTPQVVATHVAPRSGVSAAADGSRVTLRFSTTGHPGVALDIDPESLEVLGTGTANVPSPLASQELVAVRLDDGRGLQAWTDGSVYEGKHAVARGFAGNTLGATVDVSSEGSAIGQPAAALTSSGRGVFAFIESNGAGFHLVVTRLTCGETGLGG